MKNKKLKLILDAGVVVLIVAIILITLYGWSISPMEIPNHIDSDGTIKDYVSRNFLFFLMSIATIMGLLILVLSNKPQLYNYPFKISEDNKEKVYNLATCIMKAMNIEILLLMLTMQIMMILGSISLLIFIVFMSTIVSTLIIGIMKMIKYKS